MKLLITLLLITFSTSCGQKIDDKRGIVCIDSEDQYLKNKIEKMVNLFNYKTGKRVLVIVECSLMNSSSVDFQDLDKILGLGGYKMWQVDYGTYQTIEMTSHVTLDTDFFRNADDYQAWLLFCHEFGHVFAIDHVEDMSSVMYPYIDKRPRDFYNFFQQVNRNSIAI